MPRSVCFLSGPRRLCCDTGCVVVSHRKSKDRMHLQWVLMSALEVMAGLLGKLVIGGSGDLMLPPASRCRCSSRLSDPGRPVASPAVVGGQASTAAVHASDAWETLGGEPPSGEGFGFFRLTNRLVRFSSVQTQHASHLWGDPRAKQTGRPSSSLISSLVVFSSV